VILSSLEVRTILGWLGKQANLELVYRASHDGWRTKDFHSKCDNQGATVTVIKSTGGYVFGGYVDLVWASRGQYLPSSNACLFALQYPSGVAPVKMPVLHPQNAILDYRSCGPTFGSFDIHVDDNANSNSNRYTKISSYHLPAGQNSQTFFTGARNFQASEIEVFRVISLSATASSSRNTPACRLTLLLNCGLGHTLTFLLNCGLGYTFREVLFFNLLLLLLCLVLPPLLRKGEG
jgi:hypothetical protein